MNRLWNLTSWLAMFVIILVMGYIILGEADRQQSAAETLQSEAIDVAIDVYAENCVVCHGAAGEGILAIPPLKLEALQTADEATLFKTIARGRYGTTMAAWAVDEGGILSNTEIEQMIILLQYGDWEQVENRVAELGLTPPEPVVIEVDPETLNHIAELPDGQAIASGLQIYSETCVACHGTGIAPDLNTENLRMRLTDADLAHIISDGVAGTIMSGWTGTFTTEQIADLVTFIRQMDVLNTQGIELSTAPPPLDIELTPELIAEGQALFNVLCVQCHGANGYGTQMAPALNTQPFLSDTPDVAIMQIIAGGVSGTVMPAWRGYLTDAQIQAITAYLRSWEPTALPTIQ